MFHLLYKITVFITESDELSRTTKTYLNDSRQEILLSLNSYMMDSKGDTLTLGLYYYLLLSLRLCTHVGALSFMD